MAQPAFSSVDTYLDAQPPAARRILRRVRTVLRQALPTAEENISYQIPTYSLPGGPVIYFAGWKDHLSLYPVSEPLIAELVAAVPTLAAPIKQGKLRIEKGTLRIPYAESLPVHLISHLAQLRAKQVASKAAAKHKRRAGTAERPAAKSAATPQPAPRAKGSTPPSTAAKARGVRGALTSGKAKPSAASAARASAKSKPAAARAARAPTAARTSRPSAKAKAKPSAAKRR